MVQFASYLGRVLFFFLFFYFSSYKWAYHVIKVVHFIYPSLTLTENTLEDGEDKKIEQ